MSLVGIFSPFTGSLCQTYANTHAVSTHHLEASGGSQQYVKYMNQPKSCQYKKNLHEVLEQMYVPVTNLKKKKDAVRSLWSTFLSYNMEMPPTPSFVKHQESIGCIQATQECKIHAK